MNNKPISLQELRKLIFEDSDINNDDDSIRQQQSAARFSTRVNKQGKSFAEEEIQRVLTTGRGTINSNWGRDKKNQGVFNDVTSKLAAMYNSDYKLSYEEAIEKLQRVGSPEQVDFYKLFVGQGKKLSEIASELGYESATEVRNELKVPTFRLIETGEQQNIKKALMAMFAPMIDGQPTIVFQLLRGSLGAYSGDGGDQGDITDTILDGFYIGFDRALQSYEANLGTFYNYVLRAAKDTAVNILQRDNSYQKDGERIATKTFSMDKPMDDSDGGSDTFAASVIDSDDADQTNDSRFSHAADAEMGKIAGKLDKGKQQTESELLYNAVIEYVDNVLRSGRSKKAADVWNLAFVQQIGTEATADKLGMSRGAVDKMINDIKRLINTKLDDFKTHLGQELGRDVHFPNDKFNPSVTALREIKAIIAKLVLESSINRLSKINEVYSRLNLVMNRIDESYAAGHMGEGQEVATMDLFQRIKQFVDNATAALNEIGIDLHEIHTIASDIQMEYPEIAKELEKTVSPMIDTMFEYPNKLRTMLQHARMRYNPTRAYGL